MLTLPDGTLAAFHSESDDAPPASLVVVDDRTRAADAMRAIRDGAYLLWTGDWHNGRQLLTALQRRLGRPAAATSLAGRWRAGRAHTRQVAEVLGRVLVVVEPDGAVDLRRAQDTRQAVAWAFGLVETRRLVALRTVIGALGAAGWTRAGLDVPGLEGRLVPRYGVFSPTRHAYVGLLDGLDFTDRTVLDTGCGTGVLGFVALQRGASRVWATDLEPRAVACARDNARRLGLEDRYDVGEHDLFPPDAQVDLALFNPPWMPEPPRTRLDRAVFDEGELVQRWLAGLHTHLRPGGRGVLLVSDLAERLGLRPEGSVREAVARAGLMVLEHTDAPATHKKARDARDPLHVARAAERVQCWEIGRGT